MYKLQHNLKLVKNVVKDWEVTFVNLKKESHDVAEELNVGVSKLQDNPLDENFRKQCEEL